MRSELPAGPGCPLASVTHPPGRCSGGRPGPAARPQASGAPATPIPRPACPPGGASVMPLGPAGLCLLDSLGPWTFLGSGAGRLGRSLFPAGLSPRWTCPRRWGKPGGRRLVPTPARADRVTECEETGGLAWTCPFPCGHLWLPTAPVQEPCSCCVPAALCVFELGGLLT